MSSQQPPPEQPQNTHSGYSQQGPYPQQGYYQQPNYYQQPSYYPPQQPHKNNTLRNVLIAVGAVLVLGCGGCLALVAGLSEVDDPSQGGNTNADGDDSRGSGGDGNADNGPDNSTATKDGPLTCGNWQLVSPIELRSDGLQEYEAAIRVKNTGEAQDEGFSRYRSEG